MSAALAIEARKLTKRFGDTVAVDGIDLAVREGELFGILGPNGAGKTTLVRMLIGLLPITSGEAWVAGVDVRRDPDAVRRALGGVPQALTSDLDLTGQENLDIFARLFSMRGAERRERIEELLHRVGLWERRKSLVKTYSGGMRRRSDLNLGMLLSGTVVTLVSSGLVLVTGLLSGFLSIILFLSERRASRPPGSCSPVLMLSR